MEIMESGRELSRGNEEKIYVSVRLRPLNNNEISSNDVSDWESNNNDTIVYKNASLLASERSMDLTAYTFDRVFGSDCSTREVYERGAKDVALSVVHGMNSTIFAYGQTSSGKTYTMTGITNYAIADIYEYIQTHPERDFVLKFSAMEIYNESVRDLLSADSTPLRLLDDPETIESSSHESLGRENASTLEAAVNFVDLAGSERASQSLSAGTRLKEGCHINRSLLTLGTVIRKLSKERNGHIPYRDSKLTRILQTSLGGNARTAIICTMSPARTHAEQSRNTLSLQAVPRKEKDSQIEKVINEDGAKAVPLYLLEKEIKDLILQRDIAQAQVKKLLQILGEDASSMAQVGLGNYPHLRVQISSDAEIQDEETPISPDPQFFDVDAKAILMDTVGVVQRIIL
ncbi:UNVERIFIED_CONTAM: Kinesin-like protein KIN-7G [Sesamum radiatum]|uniref:Kinesin-like protein KIN-7G n=1 Tax=Sesamum radiatum TaxID=300843 RepID=A0AAW2V5G3_SESRA